MTAGTGAQAANRDAASQDRTAATLSAMALKPCFLSQVLIDEQAEQQVVFITEREGTRRIPIVIGQFEAAAIDRAVKGTKFERPLTHDLFINLLATLGLRLHQVRVVDLRKGTFFAELVLRGADDKDVVIDCRPSDAIAILVRLPGTALAVEEAVLEEAGS